MKINEIQLRNLIKESIEKVLSEAVTNKVDNFDMISNMLNLTDPDQFYFVQIIKRWKDNSDKGMTKNMGDTYHAGGDYGNFKNGTAFKVRTAQELQSLKQQIVSYCDKNNARAYITSNPRSQSAIDGFKQSYLDRLKRHNRGVLPKYADYAEEILAAQAKEDASWTDRPRFFLDIDTKDQRIWNITKAILKHYNITIENEYTTPSGGLHVVIPNRFAIQNLRKVIEELRVFDGFKDMGKHQTVHANFDGKLILYSNVDTAGY
jgi:hypothetical protein